MAIISENIHYAEIFLGKLSDEMQVFAIRFVDTYGGTFLRACEGVVASAGTVSYVWEIIALFDCPKK